MVDSVQGLGRGGVCLYDTASRNLRFLKDCYGTSHANSRTDVQADGKPGLGNESTCIPDDVQVLLGARKEATVRQTQKP